MTITHATLSVNLIINILPSDKARDIGINYLIPFILEIHFTREGTRLSWLHIMIFIPFLFAILVPFLYKKFTPRIHTGWFVLFVPLLIFIYLLSFIPLISKGNTATATLP
jgi:hypothetical protein